MELLVICNNTKENFLLEPKKINAKFQKNDILHMKFSEFYLCFHNSWGNLTFVFSRSHEKLSLVLLQITNNTYSP